MRNAKDKFFLGIINLILRRCLSADYGRRLHFTIFLGMEIQKHPEFQRELAVALEEKAKNAEH